MQGGILMNKFTDSQALAERIVALAEEKKAQDLVSLDLRGITLIADYFIIMSAANNRQAQAISDHIYETLKDEDCQAMRVEGYREGQWILLDYSSVVVHIFQPDQRDFYDLERLWKSAAPAKQED